MFNHFGAILERTTCEVFHGKDGVEKRRRSVIATTPSVPFSQLCKVLKAIGDEVAQPMQLTRCVDDEVNIATPYGNLLMESEIPMAEGEGHGPTTVTLHHVNPFALLYTLCDKYARFGLFLRECYERQNNQLRKVALYSDETVPGNQLRPDNSRQVQCIYFTLMFLPSWHRRLNHGWLPFGYMRTEKQHELEGGLSSLMRVTLRPFFCRGDFGLHKGMLLATAK